MGLSIASVLLKIKKKVQVTCEQGLGGVSVVSSNEMPIGQVMESKICLISPEYSLAMTKQIRDPKK